MIDKTTLKELVTKAFHIGYDGCPIDNIMSLYSDTNTPVFGLLEIAYKKGHSSFVENQVLGYRNPEFYLRDFLKENKLT